MYVLYNAAHGQSSIRSPDGDAWIRILGYYENRESALSEVNEFVKNDEGIEVRIAPLNEFRVILNMKMGADASAARDREAFKHAFNLDAHAKSRLAAREEIAENSQNKKVGNVKYSAEERMGAFIEPDADLAIEKKDDKTPTTKKIPTSIERRMQRFAAIACVCDYEAEQESDAKMDDWEKSRRHFESSLSVSHHERKEAIRAWNEANPLPRVAAEPLVAFLFAGNTEDEVKAWILDAAKKPAWRDYDIACVSMYEWIRVSSAWSQAVRRIFREPFIQRLFDNKEFNRKQAEELSGHVPVTEISGLVSGGQSV